jgi:hypothetical protein
LVYSVATFVRDQIAGQDCALVESSRMFLKTTLTIRPKV